MLCTALVIITLASYVPTSCFVQALNLCCAMQCTKMVPYVTSYQLSAKACMRKQQLITWWLLQHCVACCATVPTLCMHVPGTIEQMLHHHMPAGGAAHRPRRGAAAGAQRAVLACLGNNMDVAEDAAQGRSSGRKRTEPDTDSLVSVPAPASDVQRAMWSEQVRRGCTYALQEFGLAKHERFVQSKDELLVSVRSACTYGIELMYAVMLTHFVWLLCSA